MYKKFFTPRIILVTLLLIISGIAIRCIILPCYGHTAPRESLEALIKSHVPIGSDKSRVVKFLDTHKIQHSSYNPSQGRYVIQAVVRGSSANCSIKQDFGIDFWFNPRGKITTYHIHDLFTGP